MSKIGRISVGNNNKDEKNSAVSAINAAETFGTISITTNAVNIIGVINIASATNIAQATSTANIIGAIIVYKASIYELNRVNVNNSQDPSNTSSGNLNTNIYYF